MPSFPRRRLDLCRGCRCFAEFKFLDGVQVYRCAGISEQFVDLYVFEQHKIGFRCDRVMEYTVLQQDGAEWKGTDA